MAINNKHKKNAKKWINLLVCVFAYVDSAGRTGCFRSACQIHSVSKKTIPWHSVSNDTCHDLSAMNANRDFLCAKLPDDNRKRKVISNQTKRKKIEKQKHISHSGFAIAYLWQWLNSIDIFANWQRTENSKSYKYFWKKKNLSIEMALAEFHEIAIIILHFFCYCWLHSISFQLKTHTTLCSLIYLLRVSRRMNKWTWNNWCQFKQCDWLIYLIDAQ